MADQKKLFIIDDTEVNRAILVEMFKDEFEIVEADDGDTGLKAIAETGDAKKIAAVLLDIIMPRVDGFAVLDQLVKKELHEKFPVILITAETATDIEREAYQKGAQDVIHKPFDPVIVRKKVDRAIELSEHRNELEERVAQQTQAIHKQFQALIAQQEKLNKANAELQDNNNRIIEVLCTIVEFRNMESGQHLQRIKGIVKIIATTLMHSFPQYGLNDHLIEVITNASAMHDVGKITIPDSILMKPGRLTADEFEVMKSHTTRGGEIVKMLKDLQDEEYLKISFDIARHHNERYDGNGYPDRLKGDEISIAAQLTSIADVYDALCSDRVYKSAYSPEKAHEMILAGECGVFNPDLLTSFELSRPELEALIAMTNAEE
ncbi:MAG: response regulator [Lachnospiraceae bacterium]|nr:response regulator [Lachnospiraceae bacterium]